MYARPRPTFPQMIIDLVMATDMKQHFSIVSQFGALHRLNKKVTNIGPSGLPPPSGIETPQSSTDGSLTERLSHPTRSSANSRPKVPIDSTERLLSIQVWLGCLGFRVHG